MSEEITMGSDTYYKETVTLTGDGIINYRYYSRCNKSSDLLKSHDCIFRINQLELMLKVAKGDEA